LRGRFYSGKAKRRRNRRALVLAARIVGVLRRWSPWSLGWCVVAAAVDAAVVLFLKQRHRAVLVGGERSATRPKG
jgi:hypothetical protein